MTSLPSFGATGSPGQPALPGGAPVPLGNALSPPAYLPGGERAQTPRTWTLEIPPGTVLRTSNDRLHYMEAAKVNKALRELGHRLARDQRVPRLERADILLTYIPPPRLERDRHPLASARVEDSGSLSLTAKHLIDGIKDAGVWADDNFRHVRREIYQLLEGTDPRGRLRLHIIEVPS